MRPAAPDRAPLHVRCVFRRDSGSLTLDVPPSETAASEASAWRAVARVLRSPVDAVGCALLPASCSLCGSPLPRLSPVPICDLCWSEIPFLDAAVCLQCADALQATDLAGQRCRPCRLAPPPFLRTVCYGPYQDRMRDVLHAFKYNGLHSAARPLGRLLAQAIARLAPGPPGEAGSGSGNAGRTADLDLLVIPVPLHRAKLSQRGFNQARLLAEHAIRSLRRSHPGWRLTLAPDSVIRQRPTDSQAGLSPHARRRNVQGAFAVAQPAAIAGRPILLIDDIFTTGATARAVARELLNAHAASVRVATLARARLLQPFAELPPAAVSAEHLPPQPHLHASIHQPSLAEGKEDVAG